MNKINFEKMGGLVPAVIQDSNTLQVLMIGFMNEESYLKTIETKKVWFYSRTKKRLWMKGEESKNYLNLVEIKQDCDNDSLLILVCPVGPTCHIGTASCFGEGQTDIISKLYSIIEDRKEKMPNNSYTTSLFEEGINKICAKIGEESGEVIKAGLKESNQRLVEESCDLIYHLIVLLVNRGIPYRDVVKETIYRTL